MLWVIYGKYFSEVKPAAPIEIETPNNKIEDFVPKLMRLKI